MSSLSISTSSSSLQPTLLGSPTSPLSPTFRARSYPRKTELVKKNEGKCTPYELIIFRMVKSVPKLKRGLKLKNFRKGSIVASSSGIYIPPVSPQKTVVAYFPGAGQAPLTFTDNRWEHTFFRESLEQAYRQGYGLLLVNYCINLVDGPSPCQKAFEQDAIDAIEFLLHDHKVLAEDLCVVGYSLGTFSAMFAAAYALPRYGKVKHVVIDTGYAEFNEIFSFDLSWSLVKRDAFNLTVKASAKILADNNIEIRQIFRTKDEVTYPCIQRSFQEKNRYNPNFYNISVPVNHCTPVLGLLPVFVDAKLTSPVKITYGVPRFPLGLDFSYGGNFIHKTASLDAKVTLLDFKEKT